MSTGLLTVLFPFCLVLIEEQLITHCIGFVLGRKIYLGFNREVYGKFTVLADVAVSSALRFNREVCGDFTVLADVLVT